MNIDEEKNIFINNEPQGQQVNSIPEQSLSYEVKMSEPVVFEPIKIISLIKIFLPLIISALVLTVLWFISKELASNIIILLAWGIAVPIYSLILAKKYQYKKALYLIMSLIILFLLCIIYYISTIITAGTWGWLIAFGYSGYIIYVTALYPLVVIFILLFNFARDHKTYTLNRKAKYILLTITGILTVSLPASLILLNNDNNIDLGDIRQPNAIKEWSEDRRTYVEITNSNDSRLKQYEKDIVQFFSIAYPQSSVHRIISNKVDIDKEDNNYFSVILKHKNQMFDNLFFREGVFRLKEPKSEYSIEGYEDYAQTHSINGYFWTNLYWDELGYNFFNDKLNDIDSDLLSVLSKLNNTNPSAIVDSFKVQEPSNYVKEKTISINYQDYSDFESRLGELGDDNMHGHSVEYQYDESVGEFVESERITR